MRRKARELLRLRRPEPIARTPTRPQTHWVREYPAGRIEKVVFRSEPGADVPVYWCVPARSSEMATTVICLQGHGSGIAHSIAVDPEDEATPVAPVNDSDFALSAMRHGFNVLCVEQRAFGQRRETVLKGANPKASCSEAVMHAAMFGQTLHGQRVYDVDRALDYLAERGDVDMQRVGVMGHSGGGMTSMYACVTLPRLAFCVAACSFCTFADSIVGMHHCVCNMLPDAMLWFDMPDLFGAFAPKPLMIVNGRDDRIFPVDAAGRAFKDLRRVYRDAGAQSEACRFLVGDGGHRFYADLAWAALAEAMQPHGRTRVSRRKERIR